jgi:hypothetical protein
MTPCLDFSSPIYIEIVTLIELSNINTSLWNKGYDHSRVDQGGVMSLSGIFPVCIALWFRSSMHRWASFSRDLGSIEVAAELGSEALDCANTGHARSSVRRSASARSHGTGPLHRRTH